MQSEEWRDSPGVSAASAQCYNFFQLAGLVERPAWRNGTSLAFPASDIFTLEGSAVTPACIGLLGMAGALPYCYSEAIARNGGADHLQGFLPLKREIHLKSRFLLGGRGAEQLGGGVF